MKLSFTLSKNLNIVGNIWISVTTQLNKTYNKSLVILDI